MNTKQPILLFKHKNGVIAKPFGWAWRITRRGLRRWNGDAYEQQPDTLSENSGELSGHMQLRLNDGDRWLTENVRIVDVETSHQLAKIDEDIETSVAYLTGLREQKAALQAGIWENSEALTVVRLRELIAAQGAA